MRKIVFVVFAVVWLSISVSAQKVPTFAQYPAKVEKPKVKNVNLNSHSLGKTYRTNLRNAFDGGVNFGGHFMLALWGCGTNCTQSAIIDSRTGKIFVPSELSGASLGFCDLPDDADQLEYKPNSSLLVLNGFNANDSGKENTDCGIYYYQWTGTNLKLVKFVKKQRLPQP